MNLKRRDLRVAPFFSASQKNFVHRPRFSYYSGVRPYTSQGGVLTEDTQIIALYLSRQEAAIGETAKKYGGYINRIAYNILRCREDTEEIAADTYLAAWNAIPPEIPRVLKHFLSRIARNLAFDRLDYITAKRRDVHMITLLSELDACLPDPHSDVEAAVDAKLAAGSVNRFLSQLDKKDCAVFLSRYYYSMAISEIADKLGLTERNVKYRLSCLRQKLRKQLEREGINV